MRVAPRSVRAAIRVTSCPQTWRGFDGWAKGSWAGLTGGLFPLKGACMAMTVSLLIVAGPWRSRKAKPQESLDTPGLCLPCTLLCSGSQDGMQTYAARILFAQQPDSKPRSGLCPAPDLTKNSGGANQVLRNHCSQRACPAIGLGGDPRHPSWLPQAESLAPPPSPSPRALPRIRVNAHYASPRK